MNFVVLDFKKIHFPWFPVRFFLMAIMEERDATSTSKSESWWLWQFSLGLALLIWEPFGSIASCSKGWALFSMLWKLKELIGICAISMGIELLFSQKKLWHQCALQSGWQAPWIDQRRYWDAFISTFRFVACVFLVIWPFENLPVIWWDYGLGTFLGLGGDSNFVFGQIATFGKVAPTWKKEDSCFISQRIVSRPQFKLQNKIILVLSTTIFYSSCFNRMMNQIFTFWKWLEVYTPEI